MTKLFFTLATLIGIQAHAAEILPTHLVLECHEATTRQDDSMKAFVEYMPQQDVYVLTVAQTTFAGERNFREAASRFETKMPQTPYLYVGRNYSLAVASNRESRAGYAASLKLAENGQVRPMSCFPVR